MTTYACPLFETREQALDWFEARGCSNVRLWQGPDGLIRGSGIGPEPSTPAVEGGAQLS